MADSSISVTINAPVEHVWQLLVEQQIANEQQASVDKYIRIEPEGPPVAGQVTHVRLGFLHIIIHFDRIVQAESPLTGQTIYGRVSFLRTVGEGVLSWTRDSENYHHQVRIEIKHPWFTLSEYTSTRYLATSTTSCMIVCTKQSELTFCLLPSWLTHRLNDALEPTMLKAIEASFQGIKAEAEQSKAPKTGRKRQSL
jgi:hypothetical protein